MMNIRAAILAAVATAFPLTVTGECNTAPTAGDDIAQAFNEPILIDVLTNDSDAEGHPLTVSVSGTTCTATTAVAFDLVELTPNPEIRSACTVTYTVTDDLGLTDTAVVAVSVVSGIFADGFETGGTDRWSEIQP